MANSHPRFATAKLAVKKISPKYDFLDITYVLPYIYINIYRHYRYDIHVGCIVLLYVYRYIYVVYINIFTYIARKVQAKQLPCGLIPLELPQGIAKDLGFGSTANSSFLFCKPNVGYHGAICSGYHGIEWENVTEVTI